MWCSCCYKNSECNTCDPISWSKSCLAGFKVILSRSNLYLLFSYLFVYKSPWILRKRFFWCSFIFPCSSFMDIYDVDHFINVLKDDISIVKELPNEFSWSTREYYATAIRATRIKTAPVHASANWYLENVLPVLQRLVTWNCWFQYGVIAVPSSLLILSVCLTLISRFKKCTGSDNSSFG